MRFRQGPSENNGRNNTWYTTLDNGRDLKLVVHKKNVQAQILARSNGKLYEEKVFSFPATLRVAGTFDPNDFSSEKAHGLRQALRRWTQPEQAAPVPPVQPSETVKTPLKGVGGHVMVLDDPHATPPLEQDEALARSAWELIRNGKPHLNHSVIEHDGKRATKVRIHSIDISLP